MLSDTKKIGMNIYSNDSDMSFNEFLFLNEMYDDMARAEFDEDNGNGY